MQVRIRGNIFHCFLHQTLSFYFNINTALVLDIVRSNTKLTINIKQSNFKPVQTPQKKSEFRTCLAKIETEVRTYLGPPSGKTLPNPAPGSFTENWTTVPPNFKSQSLEGSEIMNRIRSNTIFGWWENVFAKKMVPTYSIKKITL